MFFLVPEWHSSRFYSNWGPRFLSPRGPPASGVGWGHSHSHSRSTRRIKFPRAECRRGMAALALTSRACRSRCACRPAGGRTARERPRAGAFGDWRAAGVHAAMLVLGPVKCYAGLCGQFVQSVCSQGVCIVCSWLRIRQEDCGQAICAGGRAIRGVGGSLSERWARGGPV